VLIAEAVELADRIIGQAEQLARQRTDLDALNRLLVAENRRLHAPPVPLPAPISRALYPSVNAALAEPETDWLARYDQLQREGRGPASVKPLGPPKRPPLRCVALLDRAAEQN
jgi:hypothetical protein